MSKEKKEKSIKLHESQKSNEDATMSFFEHLDELRVRVIRALYVFLGGFLISYFFITQYILIFLKQPLFKILPPEQHKLYFTSLFENFLTHLKVSSVVSLFILAPYFFYEIWGFISPGLYEKEKKWVIPFILIATAFFFTGGLFAYYILFPAAFKFFIFFGAESDIPLLTINDYYTTCLKLILLFGIAFEFPVILGLLGFLGVVDSQFLKQNRRNAILIISIMSALFAPPDALSMIILIVPVYLLFELTIVFIQKIEKRRKNEFSR